MRFKNGIEGKNYLEYLLSDKVKGWDNMSSLEQLIIYRKSKKIIPSCENCDEVLRQYERYQFCKDHNLKLNIKNLNKEDCYELRNEDGFTMEGALMNDPWRIVKAFALFESSATDVDDFFKNEFDNWCDNIGHAFREGTLTDLESKLLHFISLCYTPGNFCMVPKMFNNARKSHFAKNDRWDVVLSAIQRWFNTNDDLQIKILMHNIYGDKIKEKTLYETIGWLYCFRSFDDFIEKYYCYMYCRSGFMDNMEVLRIFPSDENRGYWSQYLSHIIKIIEFRYLILLSTGIIQKNEL